MIRAYYRARAGNEGDSNDDERRNSSLRDRRPLASPPLPPSPYSARRRLKSEPS